MGRRILNFRCIGSRLSVPFKTSRDLQHFRPPRQGGVQRVEEPWSPPAVPLPGVDQLFSEPAGQRLTHLVEQLGQLDVVIPVVLPEEGLGLTGTSMKSP